VTRCPSIQRPLDEIPDGRGVQRIMADDIKGSKVRQDSVIDPVVTEVPETADARDEPGTRRDHPPFDASYQEGTPPWDIGRPQPAFVRLVDAGEVRGRVLDVGCGTGEHALLAARRGLQAIGIDAAPTAIRLAREKAARRSLDARFEVWDALDLPAFGALFDTVLDCGLFHVFDDDDRARFVASLGAVVVPGGRYFLLCFSDKQPGDWGPRRVRQDELENCFAVGWRIDSIEDTVLEITLDPEGARSWLAALTRV
jgi:SAM-dependent methyltransferase